MNKKVIIGIIATIVVVAAIVVAVVFLGKEKLEETTLSLDLDYGEEIETATATIGYPNKPEIEFIDDTTSTKKFEIKDKNCKLEVSLVELLESVYDENKEEDKSEEGYKEIKINGYDGYIKKGTYSIEGYILLANDESNINKVLNFTVEAIDSSKSNESENPESLYNLKEVQTILKSVKYNGSKFVNKAENNTEVDE